MDIKKLDQRDDVLHLRVVGRVDLESLGTRNEPIGERYGPGVYQGKILLDLAEVEYLDSSGVGWLLRCHRRSREAGGRFVIYGVPELVLQVLRVLRLDTVLDLVETENDALALAERRGS
jgi:anti-anti-sigma factor